jgi:very-short-patch-repair endonuclease
MSEPKLEDCDRSERLELEGSIEDYKHSEVDGKSGDLPTPPVGHPCLEKVLDLGKPQDRTFRSSEGIFRRREIIEYERYLKKLAQKLRQNMTLGEVLLWQRLKRKQMRGYDFDRQRPIDRYIVDFYCKDLKLAIEIDGSSHDGEAAKVNDEIRQERLESLDVRFLRFNDVDVKRNMEMVLNSIERWIDERV